VHHELCPKTAAAMRRMHIDLLKMCRASEKYSGSLAG
jgi:hypothetical protein